MAKRAFQRRVAPGTVDPVVLNIALAAGFVILRVGWRSLIRLGLRPPDTALGVQMLIYRTGSGLRDHPWLPLGPYASFTLIVLAVFNGRGSAHRRSTDTRAVSYLSRSIKAGSRSDEVGPTDTIDPPSSFALRIRSGRPRPPLPGSAAQSPAPIIDIMSTRVRDGVSSSTTDPPSGGT